MPNNILDDHDRIVDQKSHAEREGEKREEIDAKAEQVNHSKGSKNREGKRDGWDHGVEYFAEREINDADYE